MAKYFTYEERCQLEGYLKAGLKQIEIAELLGKSTRTIRREIQRGQKLFKAAHFKTVYQYRAKTAQAQYEQNRKHKGRKYKLLQDKKLMQYIEKNILEKEYSPDIILGRMKLEGRRYSISVCTTTLYRAIHQGVFSRVADKDLRFGTYRKSKKPLNQRISQKHPFEKSIENRPSFILDRKEKGHWEMDCVLGNRSSQNALLVLTERVTRYSFVFRLKHKTQKEVIRILNQLEATYQEEFSNIFKTITVDNGSEFLDHKGIEQSIYSNQKRTVVYFCHPFSSWERGSNENFNGKIRWYIPKGLNIDSIPNDYLLNLQQALNNRPRRILGYRTPFEMIHKVFENLYLSFFEKADIFC